MVTLAVGVVAQERLEQMLLLLPLLALAVMAYLALSQEPL